MGAGVSAHLKFEVNAVKVTLQIFRGVVLMVLLGEDVAMLGEAEVLRTEWKVVGLQYSQRTLASVV